MVHEQARPGAPGGAELQAAIEQWRELPTDEGASFDKEVHIDAGEVSPQVTGAPTPGWCGR